MAVVASGLCPVLGIMLHGTDRQSCILNGHSRRIVYRPRRGEVVIGANTILLRVKWGGGQGRADGMILLNGREAEWGSQARMG